MSFRSEINGNRYWFGLALIGLASWLLAAAPRCPAEEGAKLSESEAYEIGVDAYIYAYPLMTMDTTRRVMTNVPAPEAMKAPMGQFVNAREYPTAEFRDVTAPNADTLYSSAWLDLAKEPYVLHLPDEGDRYYLMPMLDAWTNVFASPGTRTTGTKAGDYAITGPGWQGTLPEGVKQIKAPTNMVWILGRTYCSGTPEDFKAVHAIQDQYALTSLSAWGKPYTPSKAEVDPEVEMKTPPRAQVNKMDAAAYFKAMAGLMKDNPPAKADASMIAKLTRIGLIPGQDFDLGKLDPAVAKGLDRAAKEGLSRITAEIPHVGKDVNNWQIAFTGDYGTKYLFRAAVAYLGLGANKPEDACYPVTSKDSEGQPLTGANQYVIHFAKGEMPPVNGFWSLTMYDTDYYFVPNPLNRYTLSQRDKFATNADGSVDLRIQHGSPGKAKEANWLPAPEGQFVLFLRLYWPKESFLKGEWAPPPVMKTKEKLAAAQAKIDWLFVQNAEGVSFDKGKMTLKKVNPMTVMFADRPERIAGHLTTKEFLPLWTEGKDSFTADPPNATLSVFNDKGEPSEIVMVISNPQLQGNELTYDVRLLEGKEMKQGGACSLFIDIIGMPRTPRSFAGAGRRSYRRSLVFGRPCYARPGFIGGPVVYRRPVVVW